jgi:hypothetical protein
VTRTSVRDLFRRHWRHLVLIALTGLSYAIYSRLFDAAVLRSTSSLFLYGMIPVLAALAVAIWFEGSFLPVVATAAAIFLALPVTLYAYSPDVSFYAGKTLWAARGEPFVDPAMGIPTGYPPIFHIVTGFLVRVFETSPFRLLRYVSVWDLIGTAAVMWTYARRNLDKAGSWAVLWLLSLALITKEMGFNFFASAACASMPLALAGWLLWADNGYLRETGFGALSLGLAILIWPAHLFSVLGVALVSGWRHIRDRRAWLYMLAAILAIVADWLVRRSANTQESWTGLQLLPHGIGTFIVSRLIGLATLGSDTHGLLVALIGVATLVLLIALALAGIRVEHLHERLRNLGPLAMGLGFGAFMSTWLMIQPSYGIRLAFLAAAALVPLASAGVDRLRTLRLPSIIASRPAWVATLGLLWLAPLVAGATYTARSQARYVERDAPTTQWLAVHTQPGERVWATSFNLRRTVLGSLPLYGFLAHEWPDYYGAPRERAARLAGAYRSIARFDSSDDCKSRLKQLGVDWVILAHPEDDTLTLAAALSEQLTPAFHDQFQTVYQIKDSVGPVGVQPATSANW